MREDTRASAPVNSRALYLHRPRRASFTAHENRYLESRALFARAPAPLAWLPKLAAPDMNRGERRVKGPPEGVAGVPHTIERRLSCHPEQRSDEGSAVRAPSTLESSV